jgi:flagellar protein FliO/FliZ
MTWETLPDLVRLFLALAIVLALMGGLAFVMKKLGLAGTFGDIPGKKGRLKLLETLPLDARRRLVLIQRDDRQHLVILGVNGETVVEAGIESQQSQDNEQTE